MAYLPAANRPTKRVKLPSNKKFWVDIYTTKNWADRKALRDVGLQDGDTLIVAADLAFKLFIADWNLDDAASNKLPLTQESYDLLAGEDIDVIMDALAPIIAPPSEAEEEAKKKGTMTSSEKLADPSPAPQAELPPTS